MRTLDGPRPDGHPFWLDLAAPDAPAAAEFYAALFGWTYSVSGPEYGNYHVALLADRPVAGIGEPFGDAAGPSRWTLYLASSDIDADVARAREAGATIVAEPMEIPAQGHMAVLLDPTGASFALWQPIEHTGFGATDAHGTFSWAELSTPDPKTAAAFYSALFGFDFGPVESDDTERYDFGSGEQRVASVSRGAGEPRWRIYFAVDDVDAAAEAARHAGGDVLEDPFDTQFGRITVVRDPNGAEVDLLQPPARG
jgi:uncharacterized protein